MVAAASELKSKVMVCGLVVALETGLKLAVVTLPTVVPVVAEPAPAVIEVRAPVVLKPSVANGTAVVAGGTTAGTSALSTVK